MEQHRVVSQDEWIAARKAHLAEEKVFTKARDALSEKRRELPWVRVEKSYVFDGPNGQDTTCHPSVHVPSDRHTRYNPDAEEGTSDRLQLRIGHHAIPNLHQPRRDAGSGQQALRWDARPDELIHRSGR